MAKDKMPLPPEDAGADGDTDDTDEWLGDHPEAAPDESRISSERVKDLGDASIRRRANVGDMGNTADKAQPPAGRGPSEQEGGFDHNADFMGNEAKLATDADYSRGSGWLGGKLWGEDGRDVSSAENTPPESAHPQGTGSLFGRDVGSSGLPGVRSDEDPDDVERRRASMRRHAEWSAILGKLGGGSPGSGENLQLIEKFAMVRFPSSRDEVLRRLPPGSVFRIRDLTLDLRETVLKCPAPVFNSISDLIDCVKDALRGVEKWEQDAFEAQEAD